MNTIYFDNNATTCVAPEVRDAMMPFFNDLYGTGLGEGLSGDKA